MKTTINRFSYLLLALGVTLAVTSCKRSDDPVPDIPPSDGTQMTLNGGEGGSAAENTVFVDLSADKQTPVKRTTWNLGFYNGNQFRVILNSTSGSSAIEVNETDINAVNADNTDLEGLNIALGTPGAFDNIDDLTGDISKTLIPEISETENNNKVYVINTSGGSHGAGLDPENLFKVRILKAGDDYTLQYAEINATNYQSITIRKDQEYNFQYFSFDRGLVDIEPSKGDWDFQWTWSLYFGETAGGQYPYGFSDLVFINSLAGVSAAEVIFQDEDGKSNGEPSYEDFSESDLPALSLSTSKGVIGANWRVTPSPSPGVVAGAKKDRFYVIKDAAGNYYKLKFNSFTPEDAGKRGYPELEYKLIKRG